MIQNRFLKKWLKTANFTYNLENGAKLMNYPKKLSFLVQVKLHEKYKELALCPKKILPLIQVYLY